VTFEIVNPSDPYTIETDDFAAACVATILLGVGKYALDEKGGEKRQMPLLFLGGATRNGHRKPLG